MNDKNFKLIVVDGTDMAASPPYWEEFFATRVEAVARAAEVNNDGVKVLILGMRLGICG